MIYNKYNIFFFFAEQEASKIKSFLKYNFQDKEGTMQRWQQCMEYRLNELINCNDANIKNIIDN